MDKYDTPQYHGKSKNADKNNLSKKRYISIYWKCCHSFSRIYKNKEGSAYEGVCPKCKSALSVPVGDHGTTQRTFIAE